MQQIDDLLNQIAQLKAENAALNHEKNSYKQQWERAAAMLNSYDGAIWYVDTNYRLLEYNDRFEKEIIELYGRVPQRGDFVFGAEDINTSPASFWIAKYNEVLKGEKAVFSFPIPAPNKNEYYECYLFPIKNAQGDIIGVNGFKVNITERKEVESLMHLTQTRLSLAHQVAKLGTWTLYFETGEIHLSEEMQMMLELDAPYQNPLIMQVHEYQTQFVQKDSLNFFSSNVENIYEHKDETGYTDKYEYTLYSAKGNERSIFVKRTIVQKGVVEGVSQDITEFKTIEKEHAQLTTDLLQKVKDADQFTYIVSHNLRSPVARLLGLSSLFQIENPNSEHNHFIIKTIQKVVSQLDTVITDLNAILSLKKDVHEDLEVISLTTLLENVLEFVRNDIEKTHTKVKIDVSRTPEILAIPSYAHSIFTNFLTNAMKYKHPDREAIIQINSFPTTKYIRVDVADNGMGMEMEKVKARLFAPFSRFHGEYKIEGKGLGLFLVKTQIEAMGGKIEIQSHLGVGTTFFVYFPIPQ